MIGIVETNLKSGIDRAFDLQKEICKSKDHQKKKDEEVMENLVRNIGAQTGIYNVSIKLIDRDEDQPRTVFPVDTIRERVESLRRFGQQTPIILIPKENGRYKLFDGELRYRSAQVLNWTHLDAVFISPKNIPEAFTVFENQVITSIHAQRLHDLDLANALIKLLSDRYENLKGMETRIPKLLNTTIRRLERKHELKKLSEIRLEKPDIQAEWIESLSFKAVEEQQIFEFLLELQLNPLSINSNVFPLLKLSTDLAKAIQIKGLESSKAKEINKISAERLQINETNAQRIRNEIIEDVLAKKLSLASTRSLVNGILKTYQDTKGKIKTDKRISTIESIDVSTIQDLMTLKKLKKTLTVKLTEVNDKIKSSSKNQTQASISTNFLQSN